MGSLVNKEDELLDYKITIFLCEFNKQKDVKYQERKRILDSLGIYDKISELVSVCHSQKELDISRRILNDYHDIDKKISTFRSNIPIILDHKNSYLLIHVFKKISYIKFVNLLPEIIDYIVLVYKEMVFSKIISIEFEVMKNTINIIRNISL